MWGGKVGQPKSYFHDKRGRVAWTKKVILHDKGGFGATQKVFFLPTKSGKTVYVFFQELLWAYEVTLSMVF